MSVFGKKDKAADTVKADISTEGFGFYRVCTCVPDLRVADTEYNADKICEKIKEASEYKPAVIAFPELAVTGYSCQDLFFQQRLIDASNAAIVRILGETRAVDSVIIVGAPLKYRGSLYNGAYVMYRGVLKGVSVKTFIPNYSEFYEERWFASADSLKQFRHSMTGRLALSTRDIGLDIDDSGDDFQMVTVGNNIIYDIDGVKLGIEICEDLWAPIAVSRQLCLAGAEVIVNISASNEVISKRGYRRTLITQASAENICEYIYVSAGSSESTQDLIFSGHSVIAENGRVLNENRDFIANNYFMIADMDLGRIRCDRLRSTTYTAAVTHYSSMISEIVGVDCGCTGLESDGKYVGVYKRPFIPSAKDARLTRCNEIFDMQVGGLAKRLSVTGCKPVIGVSGGMDSTLALLVAAKALRKLKRPESDLIAVTMPGLGTSGRTKSNALGLMESLGATCITIDISDACMQHFKDLGHDPEVHDITYENTQARERTQILMDIANQDNGLVVGTGDLSELALGWCTYNGDQMSMYNVNGSIPKTLVRWMIDSVVESDIFPDSEEYLRDILDTPISPELLPTDADGNITQITEDSVGPYELHDFFLYYSFRFGYTPRKIYFLAKKAFKKNYSDGEILKWMRMFYRRFFAQQFKRSCMPDGVKVGSVSLSPRGDLRMPSDAASTLWLSEVDELITLYGDGDTKDEDKSESMNSKISKK